MRQITFMVCILAFVICFSSCEKKNADVDVSVVSNPNPTEENNFYQGNRAP